MTKIIEENLHNRQVSSPVPIKEGHWGPAKRLLKVTLGHAIQQLLVRSSQKVR